MNWIKAEVNDDLHQKVKAYRDHDKTNAENMHEAACGLLRRGAINFEFEHGELLK